MKLEQNEYKK